jgi:hypothetical protein
MSPEILIRASCRSPVDLAAELRDWREFVEGEEYSVKLEDKTTGENVIVYYIDDWESDYLSIKSTAPGALFDRVVGRVVRVLTMHNGELKVRRDPYDPDVLFTPKFKRN